MSQGRIQNKRRGKINDNTKTCFHCRYEYPAELERCSICGYPWPWIKDDLSKKRKTQPKSNG